MTREAKLSGVFNRKLIVLLVVLLLVGTSYESQSPQTTSAIDMQADVGVGFIGETAGDLSGYSVSDAGDVNNDGYDDFLIGAYQNTEGGNDAGKTYLILGSDQWTGDITLDNANASFIGEQPYDYSGHSVSGVGDVNNDNYDDFVIGAYGNDDIDNAAGKSYLILGRPTSNWAKDVSLSNANASFVGEVALDNSGFSVSGAGDVNDDGYDDFLIGAYQSQTQAGQTYLLMGRPTSWWSTGTSLANANASFIGELSGDYAGYSVSDAGDVNTDGYDDILIGAYKNSEGGDDAGQTYLVMGRQSNQWSMDVSLANANASFVGEGAYHQSGYSVSGAGDVNNDGYDDIIIGADENDDVGNAAGKSYIIFGGPSNRWSMDLVLSNANASFVGEAADDYSGHSVSGTGDFNQDGYDDVLIGAYGNDESYGLAGKTYLILGKPTQQWMLDVSLDLANISFLGEALSDQSGVSVSGAGDVNGDGFDDLLFGANGNDDGGLVAGKSYLIMEPAVNRVITETMTSTEYDTITETGPTETETITDTITETGPTITEPGSTITESGTTFTETGEDGTITTTVETVFTSTTIQTEQKSEAPVSMVGILLAMSICVMIYYRRRTRS